MHGNIQLHKQDAIKLLQIGSKSDAADRVPAALKIMAPIGDIQTVDGDVLMPQLRSYLHAQGVEQAHAVSLMGRSNVPFNANEGGAHYAAMVFNLAQIEGAAGMSYETAQARRPAATREVNLERVA